MFLFRLLPGVVLIVITIHLAFGQDINRNLADSILKARGELIFSFDSKHLTSDLAKSISVKSIIDSVVNAYANEREFGKFLSYKIPYQIQSGNFKVSYLKSAEAAALDSVYPSYPKYLQMMQGFESQYSSLCQLSDIGHSVNGRKILMLKICSPVKYSGVRPKVMLSSSIHGDELTGYKLMLYLIDDMLLNYGKDELVTRLMDNVELWINPLANPDGTFFGGDNTVTESKRYNINNVDLNRNYPDPDEGNHPDGNTWQIENVAMMDFYKAQEINLSVNFHTGVEVVNYPWDTWTRLHPDDTWYKLISRQYADSATLASGNTYMNSSLNNFDRGIVNGYAWYRITGGRQDYFNYFQNGREVTIELSTSGLPDSARVANFWHYNRISMLRYIEQCLFGIKGVVTDKNDGSPISAKIEILDHDKDNSSITSSSENGVFFRFLAPGNYDMQVSATGYQPVKLENIAVNSFSRTDLDIRMEKFGTNAVFPNPFSTQTYVYLDSAQVTGNVTVKLYNVTGQLTYENVFAYEPGYPLTVYLSTLSEGVYIMKVEAAGYKKTYKVVKLE
jgi:hypothetical protein